jgi:hypothetical protein
MASLAPVEVVAFDIDGVLVEPKFATVLPDLLNRPPSEISKFFGGPFERCLLGHADLLAELPVVLRHWEWQGDLPGEFRTIGYLRMAPWWVDS